METNLDDRPNLNIYKNLQEEFFLDKPGCNLAAEQKEYLSHKKHAETMHSRQLGASWMVGLFNEVSIRLSKFRVSPPHSYHAIGDQIDQEEVQSLLPPPTTLRRSKSISLTPVRLRRSESISLT